MPDTRPHNHSLGAAQMKAALKTLKGDFDVSDVEALLMPGVGWAKARVRVAGIGGTDPRKGSVSIPLEWQRIQTAEIPIIPSASYAYRDIYPQMQTCLGLLAKGKLNAKKIITHRFPIDDINTAFKTALDKAHTQSFFVAIEI